MCSYVVMIMIPFLNHHHKHHQYTESPSLLTQVLCFAAIFPIVCMSLVCDIKDLPEHKRARQLERYAISHYLFSCLYEMTSQSHYNLAARMGIHTHCTKDELCLVTIDTNTLTQLHSDI